LLQSDHERHIVAAASPGDLDSGHRFVSLWLPRRAVWRAPSRATSEVAIADGKITADGKNVTFKVTLDFGGMPFVMNYKGVVAPTEIKLTAEITGMPMPFEILVKKAPATPAAPAAR
jgi:hypothetical protein